MEEIDRLIRRHQNWSRLSAAFFYSICVAVALNMFWEPGGVFASGITGAAQLLATIVRKWFNFNIALPFFSLATTDLFSTGTLLFFLNVPLFVLAWKAIGHRFTLFTFLAVIFSTIMIRVLGVLTPLTKDPIVCGIFGAVVNGLGTGFALRNNISTGGIDILGIVLRKRTGRTVGTINIMFNVLIIFFAGFVNDWPHALYSALAIFINGRVYGLAVYSPAAVAGHDRDGAAKAGGARNSRLVKTRHYDCARCRRRLSSRRKDDSFHHYFPGRDVRFGTSDASQ